MKRLLLITFSALLISLASSAQSINTVASARIIGVDGKAELVFEEALTENFTVDVIDLTGNVMFTLKLNCEKEPCASVLLPIENLRKGIYMVQVVSASGKTKTLKLQRN